MKRHIITLLFLSFTLTFSFQAFSQLNLPWGSQRASVGQRIGITDITIEYSRPKVNKREVWGKLVPYGMNYLGFGTAKSAPWRAGANESTSIEFTHDVKIEGKQIAAGKYALYIAVNKDNTATIFFNKNYTDWGSYFYKPSDDVLKVNVNTQAIEHQEQLVFEFNDVKANSAIASLNWEKKRFPFKIEVDVVNIVMNTIREDLNTQPGFARQNWERAATYALNNGQLDQAIEWVDAAISGNFFSKQTFQNSNLKARILNKMGKQEEAILLLDSQLHLASSSEAYRYGSTLISYGKKDKAYEVFNQNAKKHKGTWETHHGLAIVYSNKKSFKSALKHLEKALALAPNYRKRAIEADINKVKSKESL